MRSLPNSIPGIADFGVPLDFESAFFDFFYDDGKTGFFVVEVQRYFISPQIERGDSLYSLQDSTYPAAPASGNAAGDGDNGSLHGRHGGRGKEAREDEPGGGALQKFFKKHGSSVAYCADR